MVTTLDLLIVEDSDDDVTLVLRELERSGFRPRSQRCEDPDGFRAALHHAFDIILCDYSLSAFSFVEALEILKSSGRGIPMVLVSGTIGEEAAVEAMRLGAADHVLKDRLARLGIVVERELRDRRAREEAQRMRAQLLLSDRLASVGVLAAGVAHEINNPLAVISANLEILERELAVFRGALAL